MGEERLRGMKASGIFKNSPTVTRISLIEGGVKNETSRMDPRLIYLGRKGVRTQVYTCLSGT